MGEATSLGIFCYGLNYSITRAPSDEMLFVKTGIYSCDRLYSDIGFRLKALSENRAVKD